MKRNTAMHLLRLTLLAFSLGFLGACSTLGSGIDNRGQTSAQSTPGLADKVIQADASTSALPFNQGVVLSDNEQAFISKLNMIKSAQSSIDLAYYIYSEDYTTSLFSYELIEAAKRGVKVRMLLDYHTNYKNLDFFSMLESYGNSGTGSLQVRFYNRPTQNIVKDATYLTLGCGSAQVQSDSASCSTMKYRRIEQMFENEVISGRAADSLNISNLNYAGSGLFLSGLYAKNPKLIAMAVLQGQNIDLQTLKDSGSGQIEAKDVLELAKIYWLSERAGNPVSRLVNKLKLAFVMQMYSEQINPVINTLKSYAPVQHLMQSREARRDWDYLTDFLHHKFLLVDAQQLQIGGRNMEDSYHMPANSLTDKYIFMDTDVYLRLDQPQSVLTGAFERLWNFDNMVAGIKDIRQHAPNDYLVATQAAETHCKSQLDDTENVYAACLQQSLNEQQKLSWPQRLPAHYQQLTDNRRVYLERYQQSRSPGPQFSIDRQAKVYYLENLPLAGKDKKTGKQVRQYGAENGKEAQSGKHIHKLWIEALRHVCDIASAERPQQVIFHNAYFFLPSNVLRQLAAMIDGTQDCRYVTVKVLTNSITTTDLNVVNIAARQSIKAFVDYRQQLDQRKSSRSAQFQYYEYLPQYLTDDGKPDQSLHSKVMIFGPDIYIGSANADIRSYMMDSNNGFYISEAPQLIARYRGWLEQMMSNPARTQNLTGYFAEVGRSQMEAEDLAVLRQIIQRYNGERWLNPQQIWQLELFYKGILNTIYQLSLGSLQPGRAGREPQADLNRYFKLI